MTDKLLPPEQWVMHRMSEIEVAEMIERYIEHYVEDKDGNRRSVHYPSAFVQHYMTRYDGALPTVTSFATMPIVLADGGLLAPERLDRKRGIQFLIPDALRAIIPRKEDCTPEAVKKAMEFLCDKWLVDVSTDYVGKATIIAAALTMIERALLPSRPVFFVTAGRRGNGKTTTIIMLITGVTGDKLVAAAAWSTNVEERRKALMSYLLRGTAYILWDNISRGSQISCQYIEAACTSARYTDRILGVSETGIAASTSVHFFTGNNIGAKGDLASRSLTIRLDVNRADPENREFTHTDPVAWTEQHRGEILEALYTILMGNPQLKAARNAEGKTRYKLWWRLVGSAVEHAAGAKIDFQSLFLAQEEEGDEDTASLGDVLDILQRGYPTAGFPAAVVAGMVNSLANDDHHTLREFLIPGADKHFKFSSRTITRALKRHLDEPVVHNGRTLVLRKKKNTSSNADEYQVEILIVPPTVLS